MSIIRGMHRRSRHVKKSKHAQLHAQSIPMRITGRTDEHSLTRANFTFIWHHTSSIAMTHGSRGHSHT
jgi:hypothetical protein